MYFIPLFFYQFICDFIFVFPVNNLTETLFSIKSHNLQSFIVMFGPFILIVLWFHLNQSYYSLYLSVWYFIIYFDLFTLILISIFSYGFVTLFIIQWSSLYTLKNPVIMLGPYILKKLTIFKCYCTYSNILALVLSILHLVVFLNTYIFSILYSTFFLF